MATAIKADVADALHVLIAQPNIAGSLAYGFTVDLNPMPTAGKSVIALVVAKPSQRGANQSHPTPDPPRIEIGVVVTAPQRLVNTACGNIRSARQAVAKVGNLCASVAHHFRTKDAAIVNEVITAPAAIGARNIQFAITHG